MLWNQRTHNSGSVSSIGAFLFVARGKYAPLEFCNITTTSKYTTSLSINPSKLEKLTCIEVRNPTTQYRVCLYIILEEYQFHHQEQCPHQPNSSLYVLRLTNNNPSHSKKTYPIHILNRGTLRTKIAG